MAAQRLLDSLPTVRKETLPSSAACMICLEEYGTVASDNGTIEHAVLLPCLHHVGSECITIWLSPGDGLGNSCPLCRKVFFPVHLRDLDDDDEDMESEEDSGDGWSEEDDEGGDEEEGDDEDGDDEDQDDGEGSSDESGDEDEEDGDEAEGPRQQTR